MDAAVPLPPSAPLRPIAVLPAVTAPRATIPVDSAALERAVVARFQHHPLARLLMRRTREQAIADRIARAIVKEANYLDVAPSLLTGVLLTESAPLTWMRAAARGGGTDAGDELPRGRIRLRLGRPAAGRGQHLSRRARVRRVSQAHWRRAAGAPALQRLRHWHRHAALRPLPHQVLRTARLVRRQLLLYPPYRLALDSTTN